MARVRLLAPQCQNHLCEAGHAFWGGSGPSGTALFCVRSLSGEGLMQLRDPGRSAGVTPTPVDISFLSIIPFHLYDNLAGWYQHSHFTVE